MKFCQFASQLIALLTSNTFQQGERPSAMLRDDLWLVVLVCRLFRPELQLEIIFYLMLHDASLAPIPNTGQNFLN